MATTVLSLIQRACKRAMLTAPSALTTATDAPTLQLIELFYETGEELRNTRCFPQLKRKYRFPLVSQRTQYTIPQDFYAAVPFTNWDEANRWENLGPLSDAHWSYRTYGYATIENRKGFRIFGPDINPSSTRGQFMINPTPGASSAGLMVSYEYFSRSWLLPPNWAASTNYTLNSSYVNVNGNIYRCATAGTNSSGTVPPTVGFNGEGQDGGVFWTVLATSAWTSGTLYAPGEYVTNGGNLYVCTTGGTSAGSGGPTGAASTSITDNTVSWSYCSAGSWTGETAYAGGAFIKISSTYYKNTTPGIFANGTAVSGKNQPTWTISTTTFKETDGSTSWNYQFVPYEAIITDSDLCLFDDDIMIAGLRWRFLQANRREYEDYKADYYRMVDNAQSRLNEGRSTNMAGDPLSRLRPNIPEGGFYL
jgi:hypothetical protein